MAVEGGLNQEVWWVRVYTKQLGETLYYHLATVITKA